MKKVYYSDNNNNNKINKIVLNQQQNQTMEQHEQQFIDLSFMELKSDHEKRPIWVTSDNKIFLETFNKLYR